MAYATIIIPTHDRAETLPWSIRSALNQTVQDIEVLVVGDGCTDSVRAAAQSSASVDPRVRFLDFPKGPAQGAQYRDYAIRSASSERIFYNDDDDLLLPHHVATLGEALNDSDIVDTPAVSVHANGKISLGVHDSSWEILRRLMAEQKFKCIFDTHLAHRKSAYERGEGAWLEASETAIASNFLGRLASDDRNRWHTIQRITALSFHGAARSTMTGSERASELENAWTLYSGENAEHRLGAEATTAFHVWRLFVANKKLGRDAEIFFAEGIGRISLTDKQRYSAQAAWDLAYNRKPAGIGAVLALDELLDANLGPTLRAVDVTSQYLSLFQPAELHAMLQECRPRVAVNIARFQVQIRMGQCSICPMELIESAPRWNRFYVGLALLTLLIDLNDPRSLEVQRSIFHAVPQHKSAEPYWRCCAVLASRYDLAELAEEARERLSAIN
jgi:glycosyltransferase involved in cell wall biosynthesis